MFLHLTWEDRSNITDISMTELRPFGKFIFEVDMTRKNISKTNN